jgi:ribosomal protein L39E
VSSKVNTAEKKLLLKIPKNPPVPHWSAIKKAREYTNKSGKA